MHSLYHLPCPFVFCVASHRTQTSMGIFLLRQESGARNALVRGTPPPNPGLARPLIHQLGLSLRAYSVMTRPVLSRPTMPRVIKFTPPFRQLTSADDQLDGIQLETHPAWDAIKGIREKNTQAFSTNALK